MQLALNKALKGEMNDKTCITSFQIDNQTGMNNRRLCTIGKAETPKAFQEYCINLANLLVFIDSISGLLC